MSSYLVLARKYRPQTFAEIVGQDHVTRTLANALATGRVHHAFVFTGARGVGKTTAARILAKALCCASGPTAEPCGRCEPCTEIRSGSAVDVIEIDGASNRGIDDVRTLRETVRYQPAKYRRKVVIVDEVHMLTTEAFNALLKTLEEPPPHVTFVFATTEPHRIPVTILSRCQRYDFKLIPTARLAAHLGEILAHEQIAVEPEALAAVAREAAGSARDALSLVDQVVAFVGPAQTLTRERVVEALGIADRRALCELADALCARDAEAALRVLEAAFGRGQDAGQLARSLLGHLRDLAVCAQVRDPRGLVDAPESELEVIQAQARRVDPPLLFAWFDRFTRAADEIARSTTPRMLLELALLDMVRAEPLLPLGDLLARLEDLERRTSGAPGAGASGGAPAGGGARPPVRRSAAAPAPAPSPEEPERSAPRSPAVGAAGGGMSAGATVSAAGGVSTAAAVSAVPAPVRDGAEWAPAWERLLAGLEASAPLVHAVLALAKPVAFAASGVVLAFAPGELGIAQGRKAEIDELCARTFGGRVPVTLRAVDGQAPAGTALSLDESNRRRADEERERRRAEARTHPNTRAALEVFGGAEIKDIKVDFD
jgi:DNA polymerase-3 subunit gamma/tau